MMIDEFLPVYDVVERHHVDVNARVEQVYAAASSFDLSDSVLIRWLFRLRGLPQSCLKFGGLLNEGFIVLGEVRPNELLLGLVGRFWRISGGLQRVDSHGFREFDTEGYAKAAWNFSLSGLSHHMTRLGTETRVYCSASTRSFRLYWALIGPFSSLIRSEALRIIKRKAESCARSWSRLIPERVILFHTSVKNPWR